MIAKAMLIGQVRGNDQVSLSDHLIVRSPCIDVYTAAIHLLNAVVEAGDQMMVRL